MWFFNNKLRRQKELERRIEKTGLSLPEALSQNRGYQVILHRNIHLGNCVTSNDLYFAFTTYGEACEHIIDWHNKNFPYDKV